MVETDLKSDLNLSCLQIKSLKNIISFVLLFVFVCLVFLNSLKLCSHNTSLSLASNFRNGIFRFCYYFYSVASDISCVPTGIASYCFNWLFLLLCELPKQTKDKLTDFRENSETNYICSIFRNRRIK